MTSSKDNIEDRQHYSVEKPFSGKAKGRNKCCATEFQHIGVDCGIKFII